MLQADTHTIAQVLQTTVDKNRAFTGVFTDSRQPLKGGLFVALIGANFDAHQHIDAAEAAGASAIIASAKIRSHLPTLYVDDTAIALGKIAAFHRHQNQAKVVAITGSNGKTTTKNMLANILSLQAPTLKTQGNLNNHLGVPLTLLNLTQEHQFAVVEMGANHTGEIAYLRDIASPNIAVVTNTSDAHLGEFGGFDNLLRAKGEIYGKNSTNIVNTNTLFTGDISFGENGNVFASNVHNNRFTLNIGQQKISVKLSLLGAHNIENALAASACADALGVDIATIQQGLENTQAEKGRLQLINTPAFTIIDDSYNASPTSTKVALEILSGFAGKTVAVLGTMAELGNDSQTIHAHIGQYAKTLAISHLYSTGKHAEDYNLQHFDNADDLLKKIKALQPTTVLFKGSRVAKLEQIIEKLCV